jgi:hypothetical protein
LGHAADAVAPGQDTNHPHLSFNDQADTSVAGVVNFYVSVGMYTLAAQPMQWMLKNAWPIVAENANPHPCHRLNNSEVAAHADDGEL